MSEDLTLRCSSCGTLNRVPQKKRELGLKPVCGRCKTPLKLEYKPETLTDATFAETVEQSTLPVLVDMWAPWCGPCRAMASIIDEVATSMSGRVRVAKMNIDENPQTAARFDVASIPTLLVLKNGREVDRLVGLQPKEAIVKRLNQLIARDADYRGSQSPAVTSPQSARA